MHHEDNGGGNLLIHRRLSTDLFVASLADLAMRHQVPDGKVWLPVKTEPKFGHGE
jgi:hypothetical protein